MRVGSLRHAWTLLVLFSILGICLVLRLAVSSQQSSHFSAQEWSQGLGGLCIPCWVGQKFEKGVCMRSISMACYMPLRCHSLQVVRVLMRSLHQLGLGSGQELLIVSGCFHIPLDGATLAATAAPLHELGPQSLGHSRCKFQLDGRGTSLVRSRWAGAH